MEKDIDAEMAVDKAVKLIDDLIEETENVKEALYNAFDFNNSHRWVGIFKTAKSELNPIKAELRRISKRIEEKYVP